jgi:hypothetical protein
VVLVEDCVASDDPRQHEASLSLMRHRFDLADSSEITSLWLAEELDPAALAQRSAVE